MNIAHPLWRGHTLQLQSEFTDELDMMSRVRTYVETASCLPDLTANEESFVRLLQEWLRNKNREYE
jgi:hypothetical protein